MSTGNPMDSGTLERGAARMHAKAVRSAIAVVNGERYSLAFDGNYVVTDSTGAHVVTFNTRKVTQAKQWLREYLAE